MLRLALLAEGIAGGERNGLDFQKDAGELVAAHAAEAVAALPVPGWGGLLGGGLMGDRLLGSRRWGRAGECWAQLLGRLFLHLLDRDTGSAFAWFNKPRCNWVGSVQNQ